MLPQWIYIVLNPIGEYSMYSIAYHNYTVQWLQWTNLQNLYIWPVAETAPEAAICNAAETAPKAAICKLPRPRLKLPSAMLPRPRLKLPSAMLQRPRLKLPSAMLRRPRPKLSSAMLLRPRLKLPSAMLPRPRLKLPSAMLPRPRLKLPSAMLPRPRLKLPSAMLRTCHESRMLSSSAKLSFKQPAWSFISKSAPLLAAITWAMTPRIPLPPVCMAIIFSLEAVWHSVIHRYRYAFKQHQKHPPVKFRQIIFCYSKQRTLAEMNDYMYILSFAQLDTPLPWNDIS